MHFKNLDDALIQLFISVNRLFTSCTHEVGHSRPIWHGVGLLLFWICARQILQHENYAALSGR